MSVSARESLREDRLFDELSFESMQPSDEWENTRVVDENSIDECSITEDENSFKQIDKHPTAHEKYTSLSCNEESQSLNAKESFFSNQSSFVDYLSNLVPTFSMESSKLTNLGTSFSTATYSKVDTAKLVNKAKRSGSNHSRCIIENTESIQERRDEHKNFGGNRGRCEEDCVRDQSTMSCSVEEISQISEITMDIPTVTAEHKFAQCSALPTISEIKQFDSPQIAATCAAGVRNKAQCSSGADTTTNKSEGNNDFIDFVFELVEDAMCKPITTSKSERKKVFMEAFHEESEKVVKLANKNGSRDPFRENRKHSRSSTSKKKTVTRPRNSPTLMDDRDKSDTDQVETSTHSARRSNHSRMKIIDKPPLRAPGFRTSFPLDEELTMDWSKMMSLAEKQLEAEEKSVFSKDSRISEVSRITEQSSFYQSIGCDGPDINDASVMSNKKPTKAKPKAASIYETKATIAIDQSDVKSSVTSSVSTLADDVVKELRKLSALDSSSFEEESRFILTSTLFRFMRRLIPSFSEMNEKSSEEEEHEENAFDEIFESSQPLMHKEDEIISTDDQAFVGPRKEVEIEEITFKILCYIAFVYAFVFWPSGIGRRAIPHQPLRFRVDSKPTSLLQLVSGK